MRGRLLGGYLLTGMAGAAVGAGVALWATKSAPRMMAGMMREMMAGMDSDMCRKMMASFGYEKKDESPLQYSASGGSNS